MLGGAQNLEETAAYGVPQINAAAERMTEFIAIARRYPKVKMVFSGGSGDLVSHNLSEADVVQRFAEQQGLEPGRILLEGRSRNTRENAVFARELANPRPGERWLLITSAFHMPRSAAVFKAVGWDVIPYPVDYRALPSKIQWRAIMLKRFELFSMALHEWIGLAAYRVTGRI
jgi:uncharacterized SAM-binding protein YcdF (DUF218 family)